MIGYNPDAFYKAMAGKEFFQFRLGHGVGKVADIEFHAVFLLSDQQKTSTVANDVRKKEQRGRENVKEYAST